MLHSNFFTRYTYIANLAQNGQNSTFWLPSYEPIISQFSYLAKHLGGSRPVGLPRQVDYVAIFLISVTSMAHRLFSWLPVFTYRHIITKHKALPLKSTLQQTNYQVTSSTEKLKFCELQPRSAVCFECSNRNYSLFLLSLSLFHQFSFLSPLKSPKK